MFWRQKERKIIVNHERESRTTKKHRETETTEKSSKQFQAPSQLPGAGRGSWRCHHKVSHMASSCKISPYLLQALNPVQWLVETVISLVWKFRVSKERHSVTPLISESIVRGDLERGPIIWDWDTSTASSPPHGDKLLVKPEITETCLWEMHPSMCCCQAGLTALSPDLLNHKLSTAFSSPQKYLLWCSWWKGSISFETRRQSV
jgi:hypothetical protein